MKRGLLRKGVTVLADVYVAKPVGRGSITGVACGLGFKGAAPDRTRGAGVLGNSGT